MRQKLELVPATQDIEVDLVTLEKLKLVLGLPDSEDEANAARITLASELIAEACDRQFGYASALETFEFDTWETSRGGQVLGLSLYPNITIESVTHGETVLAEADYVLDATLGRIWRAGSAPWTGIVAIAYSGGYDLPEGAPAGLEAAVIESVRGRRMSSARDPGLREVSHGDVSVGYFSSEVTAGGVSSAVNALINPYKRIPFA